MENPEKKDKYFAGLRKVASSVLSMFWNKSETSTTDDKDIKLPTVNETRSYCLKVYLADVLIHLRSGCITQMEEIISHIVNVYDCLYVPSLHNEKVYLTNFVTRDWRCNDLKHVSTSFYNYL